MSIGASLPEAFGSVKPNQAKKPSTIRKFLELCNNQNFQDQGALWGSSAMLAIRAIVRPKYLLGAPYELALGQNMPSTRKLPRYLFMLPT
jgi:hypothetical protein